MLNGVIAVPERSAHTRAAGGRPAYGPPCVTLG
ncbi:protein of unknown function [Cupriavidus taiwanensis]|nr:protein of unknown function [Cupriavidus taiwanensis]